MKTLTAASISALTKPHPGDLEAWQRREVLAWLTRMDIALDDLVGVEVTVIDCPMVTVTRIRREPGTGRMKPDPRTGSMAVRTEDHLMSVDPPAWWQPASGLLGT